MWSKSIYIVFVFLISAIFCSENEMHKPTGKDNNRIMKVGVKVAEKGVINHYHEHILNKRTPEKDTAMIKDGKLYKMIKKRSGQWNDIFNWGSGISDQVLARIKEAYESAKNQSNHIRINGVNGTQDITVSNNGLGGIQIIGDEKGGITISDPQHGGINIANINGSIGITGDGIRIKGAYEQGGEPYKVFNVMDKTITVDVHEPLINISYKSNSRV